MTGLDCELQRAPFPLCLQSLQTRVPLAPRLFRAARAVLCRAASLRGGARMMDLTQRDQIDFDSSPRETQVGALQPECLHYCSTDARWRLQALKGLLGRFLQHIRCNLTWAGALDLRVFFFPTRQLFRREPLPFFRTFECKFLCC